MFDRTHLIYSEVITPIEIDFKIIQLQRHKNVPAKRDRSLVTLTQLMQG